MELLKKFINVQNGFWLFGLAVFFTPTAFADPAGNETQATHMVRVYESDGSARNLKFSYVLDNDPSEPGVYLIGDHDGGIQDQFANYDYHLQWLHRPASKAQEEKVNKILHLEIAEHPHRILMNPNQGRAGSDVLVEFFEHAKSGYELSYKDNPTYNRHVQKRITIGEPYTLNRTEAKYTEIEKIVPDKEITIKNKDTGEEQNLSDFVDHLLATKRNDNSDVAYKLSELNQAMDSINGRLRTPDVAGRDIAVIGAPAKKPTIPKMPSPDDGQTPVIFVPFDPLSNGSGL
jgi:hypothetical protein